jgi:hypothetical protein
MRGAGLRELYFRLDFEGSKVLLDFVSRDGRLAHNHRQDKSDNGFDKGDAKARVQAST